MAVNKVVYSGSTVMDISDTTATESTVVKGKTFYKANGVKATGTAEYEPLIVKFNSTLAVSSWTAYGDYFRQTVMSSQETNAKFDLQFDISQLAQLAEDGVTAASASITFDDVMELFYSLRSPYRKKAVWVLNDSTVKALRKLKDNTGNYIWNPSVQASVPDTILNRPYKTSSYVPEIKAGNKCMAFGDFSYYWVADRQGRSFKRLNELFAMTGQVGFLASQRLDGKLILPEAIKTLTIKKA